MAEKEEKHKAAAQALAAAEREIAALERRLREIQARRQAVDEQLQRHRARLAEIETAVREQRRSLAALLRLEFRPQAHSEWAHFFSSAEPDTIARERHFGAALSEAKGQRLARLRASLEEERELVEAMRRASHELDLLARREATDRAALEAEKAKRAAALAALAREVKDTRQMLATLRAAEERLSRLVARLAEQKKKREAARRAAKEAEVAPSLRGERAKAPVRGRFMAPVAAPPANRFGAPRREGTRWKGLFYPLPAGAPVRAVADGTVVFADWLRGYGNVLIIDHGEEILSVYGHNETLYAAVGKKVARGETVAAAGATGSETETGLYFELRRRGQPIDPMEWLGG